MKSSKSKSTETSGLDLPLLGKTVGDWLKLAQTTGSNSDEVATARLYIYACLYCGYGLKKDYSAACNMILQGLKDSNTSSGIHGLIVGVCYFGGYGRSADYKKAFEIFS